jgi:hypothetical protein
VRLLDRRQNKIALRDGLRVFSSYDVLAGRVWIITEEGRRNDRHVGQPPHRVDAVQDPTREEQSSFNVGAEVLFYEHR